MSYLSLGVNKSRRAVWTPFNLKPTTIAFLIAVLLICIVALELVNWRLQHGLDVQYTTSVRALRFVPTVVAILIGFAWKGLSSDLSLVTPWAAISERWTKACDSILLNYTDSLDVVVAWQSLRRRQWALFLVVLGGLLSGILVPLANSLTEETLGAATNNTATFHAADRFVFNGSLGLAPNWRSAQVWLDYTGFTHDTHETAHFPWLTTNYAYPAFDTDGLENALIQATVGAFSASLQCESLEYKGTYSPLQWNSSVLLQSTGDSKCSQSISQNILWPWNSSRVVQYPQNDTTGYFGIPPNLWLNITACDGDDDLRLLATAMVLDIPNNLTSPYYGNGTYNWWNGTNVWTAENINVRTTGLICSPTYWNSSVSITVNGSTGMVGSGPFLRSNSAKINDIGVGLDVIQAAMNNPIDSRSRMVFEAAATNDWSTTTLPNSYNWSQFPQLKVMQNYAWMYLAYSSLHDNLGTAPADPFFELVTESNNLTAWDMFNNVSMLQDAVERNFARFLPTLVDAAARAPDNTTIHGFTFVPTDKLFIRPQILITMECILSALALIAIVVSLFLRPVTSLHQHPGSLEHVSRLLANSTEADQLFSGLGSCSEDSLHDALRRTEFRLTQLNDGMLQLQVSQKSAVLGDSASSVFELPDLGTSPDPTSTSDILKAGLINEGRPSTSSRYQPLALRIPSRLAIVVCLIAVAVAAGVILHFSIKTNGFHGISNSTSAWDLVPSIILVLIGYSIQSMLHSALSLANYTQLAANTSRSGRAMVRRHVQNAMGALVEQWSLDLTLVVIPCFLLLLGVPGLKIVAGNLFHQGIGSSILSANFPVNVSQIHNFNTLMQYVNSSYAPSYTNPYAQTLSQDYAVSRPIFRSFTSVGPLNIPIIDYNITSLLSEGPQTTQNDLFKTQMLAFNTSVVCSDSEDEDFGLFATGCNQTTGYVFGFRCLSDECESRFGYALEYVNVSTTIDPEVDTSSAVKVPYFSLTAPSTLHDSLAVLIADFSPLSKIGMNFTNSYCNGQPISAGTLGEYMPSIRGVNCTRNINLVNANITFSRIATGRTNSIGRSSDDAGQQERQTFTVTETGRVYSVHQQTDFRPVGYDPTSIELITPAINTTTWPAPVIIPDAGTTIYHTGQTINPLIEGYTLLSLLAQVQEIRSGDQLDLLNITNLASVTADIYQKYSQVALERAMGSLYDGTFNYFIPASARPATETKNTTGGQFILFKPAVKQDFGFTMACISLAIAALVCVVWIFLLVPRGTMLPKAPGSIAAQISILAGSRLVKSLRDERTQGRESSLFADQRFGLGWWPTEETQGSQNDPKGISTGMRWGIDVGVLEDSRGPRLRSRTFRPAFRLKKPRDSGQSFLEPILEVPGQTPRRAHGIKAPARATSSYQPLTLDEDEWTSTSFRRDWENSVAR